MHRPSRRSFVVGSGVSLPTLPAILTALQGATPAAAAATNAPNPTDSYKFSLVGAADSPIPGGIVHRANKAAFPMLRGIAAFSLALDPHALRQPHLHTNANELSYLAMGQARVGLVGPGGEQHVFDLAPGEVAFQPMGWVHWFENTGEQPLFAVFMYSHEQPETIDLPDVLPDLPRQSSY